MMHLHRLMSTAGSTSHCRRTTVWRPSGRRTWWTRAGDTAATGCAATTSRWATATGWWGWWPGSATRCTTAATERRKVSRVK